MMSSSSASRSRIRPAARTSALTIAASYVAGGLVPARARTSSSTRTDAALLASVGVTLSALFVFGWVKGRFTVKRPIRSAWQTLVVGGLAAGAAFGIAKLIAP